MRHLLSLYALFLISGCEQATQRALIEESTETTTTTLEIERESSPSLDYRVNCTGSYDGMAIEVYYTYHLDAEDGSKSESIQCTLTDRGPNIYGGTNECDYEDFDLTISIDQEIELPILSDGASEFELDCE